MSPNDLQVNEQAKSDLLTSINDQLKQAKERGAHVLAPMTLQQVPPMHRPVVAVVVIDPNPQSKEVYMQRGGGLSLSALSFQKFADAMGIHWDPKQCGRIDDGRNPNFVHYRMVGRVKALDGTWRPIMGDKEIRIETVIEELTDNKRDQAQGYLNDPKDGPAFRKAFPTEAAVEGWVQEKVRTEALQMKKHMLARAQTGAMARAIKSIGIRETYTAAELKNPFVFPKLVPEFDQNNPEDRAFLRHQAAGITDLAFPPAREAPASRAALPEWGESVEIHTMPDAAGEVQGQPEAASATEPTEAEVLRSDFKASTPKVQAEMLKNLMKQKGWTTKIEGEPEVWQAKERAKFFETLLARPDVGGTTKKLPF